MKWFLVLSAVVLCACALPTKIVSDIDTEIVWQKEAEIAAAHTANITNLMRNDIPMGFATVGEGTRGGEGGAVWTVWDAWALRDAVTGNEPRIVFIRGRIDLIVLFAGSPGVNVNVGSWKTIIGGDGNAEITGGGLLITLEKQIIIRNIKFSNALSFAPTETPNGSGGITNQVPGEFTIVDNIGCVGAEHVWVDHNEFSDDPWIADGIPNELMRHDGLLDMINGSNWITASNNIFRNHNKVILLGHDDTNIAQDTGRLKVTFFKNWFMGTTQRNPRVRYGEVHVLNNLYTNVRSYGIGPGAGALVYAERNVFIDSRAWRFPAGTPNPMGHLLSVENQFQNSNSEDVPSYGVTWNPAQYYTLTALNVDRVEEEVRRTAGTWS